MSHSQQNKLLKKAQAKRAKQKEKVAARKAAEAKAPKKPKNLREALKVKPVRLGVRVDVDADEETPKTVFHRMVNQPPALAEPISTPIIKKDRLEDLAPPDMSEDQRALIRAAKSAEPLMKNVPVLRQLMGGMAAFRQMYTVFYRKLHETLEAEPEGTVDVMVEDLLVQAAMYESSKPFDEHVLMQSIVDSVLPLLADIVDEHSDADRKEAIDEEAVANELRRNTPIPLGFKHAPQQEEPTLTRDRGLVLTGWEPAIMWLIDKIVERTLLAKQPAFSVVRFMKNPPKGEPNANLIRLARNAWKGCGNDKRKSLPLVMGEFVMDQLTSPPDLLICDSMADAYTRGFTGRADGASAGDAYRAFSSWCKDACCAFVGGVPTMDKSVPDVRGNDFEQLRTFAHLRSVDVQEEADGLAEDHYRIVVSHQSAVFDVPKTTLDDYGRSALILPS